MSWSDFWDSAANAVGKAFDWLNENEAASDFISGAALAMLQAKAAEDQRTSDRELVELRERREDDRTRVNYAGVDNYTGGLTASGGVLTNGLLSKAG